MWRRVFGIQQESRDFRDRNETSNKWNAFDLIIVCRSIECPYERPKLLHFPLVVVYLPSPATYDNLGSPSIRAIFECCRPRALNRADSYIPHFRHQYIQEHFSNCVIYLFLNILLAEISIIRHLCKLSLPLLEEKLYRTIPRTCGRHVIWRRCKQRDRGMSTCSV
jgi:hypothetical protein